MNVIGISGYARCGKDTFVGIATNILKQNNYRPMRAAFADVLKDDIDPWLKDKYGISAWTENLDEKKIIRPFLVAHGCGKRMQTEGKHWVDLVDKKITSVVEDCLENGETTDRIVALVSDVRFPNEAKWVRDEWGGEVIHLARYSVQKWHPTVSDKTMNNYTPAEVDSLFNPLEFKHFDSAPNDEEATNDPLVLALSDQQIEWENRGKLTSAEAIENPYLQEVVLAALNATKLFNGTLSP